MEKKKVELELEDEYKKEPLVLTTGAELYIASHRILFLSFKDDNYLTRSDFLNVLLGIKDYVKENGKVGILNSAPSNMNFDIDTWEYISTHNYEDELNFAVAIYTKALQHKIMTKTYNRKVTPNVPSKTFTSIKEAYNWLASLLKEIE